MRQFERFFSTLTRFTLCAFSADVSVFKLKLSELSNKSGINVASCSKAQIIRYTGQSSKALFLSNPTSYTNNSIVQSNSLEHLSSSNEVFPNLVSLEGDTFFLSEELPMTSNKQLLIKPSLSIESSLYQTLVLLTLFNTSRK